MITKSKIEFQIAGMQKRITDSETLIERLQAEKPILEARLAELQVELENAPEDPVINL